MTLSERYHNALTWVRAAQARRADIELANIDADSVAYGKLHCQSYTNKMRIRPECLIQDPFNTKFKIKASLSLFRVLAVVVGAGMLSLVVTAGMEYFKVYPYFAYIVALWVGSGVGLADFIYQTHQVKKEINRMDKFTQILNEMNNKLTCCLMLMQDFGSTLEPDNDPVKFKAQCDEYKRLFELYENVNAAYDPLIEPFRHDK